MKLHVWTLLFGCAVACHALSGDQDADEGQAQVTPMANITVHPSVSGNVDLGIYVYGMPGFKADGLQAALPCRWSSARYQATYTIAKCKTYVPSDGTSAQGTIAFGPLVSAMHHAGAQIVWVTVYQDGAPLTKAPDGWRMQTNAGEKPSRRHGPITSYIFYSQSDQQLPAPFEIRVGRPWQPARLAIPFAISLFGPALIALWLRKRAEAKGTVESAAIWVHWILTGNFLYWISAVNFVDITGFGGHIHLESPWVMLFLGAIVFALPPLLSTAACIRILAPPPDPTEPDAVRRLVKASVAREGALLIPLALFIIAGSLVPESPRVAIAGVLIAYFAYRILTMRVARWMMGPAVALNHGELMDNITAIAARAGVKLRAVYVFSNRAARQANAFASSGNVIAITRGLAERLTRRELNAVIGHEVGHLRGKHIGVRVFVFWAYILVFYPAASALAVRAHVPNLFFALPVLPLCYILGTAFLSRRHEFSADAKAAQLTGDPEAKIAALSRLRMITRSPIDWGGIQGSILSHPSMRDRVLAIARHSGVSDERALALLQDPDLLSAAVPAEQRHYTLPPECGDADVLLTSTLKHEWAVWSWWIRNVLVIALALGGAYIGGDHWPIATVLCLPLAVVLLGWVYEFADIRMDRLFLARLGRALRRRMGPLANGGIYAGFLPGRRPIPVDGFYLWDAGFLWLSPDSLTYRGERTSFTVPREDVHKISLERSPRAWERCYVVQVECDEGCFSLSRPDVGHSRRQTRQLEQWLSGWQRGEPTGGLTTVDPAPRPDPAVLAVQPVLASPSRWITYALRRALFLWIGLLQLMIMLEGHEAPHMAPAIFMPPLAYIFALCPLFFQRKPRTASASAPVPASATPAPVETVH